jgi:signal transduction histidine kinase
LKFTFEGNVKVKIESVKDHSNHIKISVIDTGIGIKKEDTSKLFRLFWIIRLRRIDEN